MDTNSLRTPDAAPGSAAAELNELIAKRDELVAQLHDAERSQRFGTSGVEEARRELTDGERRRLGGEATAAQVRKAEQRLQDALSASREPLAERVAASRMAVRDVEHQVGMLIGARLDELLAGLDDEAELVVDRCNAAREEFVASYRARQAVAGRIAAMAGQVRRPRFGDVALTCLEPVVREATMWEE